MKIKDILTESSVTDVVARFYKEATEDADRFFNPEIVKFKKKTTEYYDKYFEGWFKEGIVPVFEKPVTPPQPEYTNIPKPGKYQSPGYRGLQYAKAAAGLPYNHDVQTYTVNPAKIVATQTMDAVRNNNGN